MRWRKAKDLEHEPSALNCHAETRMMGDGRPQDGEGAAFSLILHDLAEGHAGGIADADVYELPAHPARVALAGAIAQVEVHRDRDFRSPKRITPSGSFAILTGLSRHSWTLCIVQFTVREYAQQDATTSPLITVLISNLGGERER
jgi:hypothetical protein